MSICYVNDICQLRGCPVSLACPQSLLQGLRPFRIDCGGRRKGEGWKKGGEKVLLNDLKSAHMALDPSHDSEC